MKRLWPYDFPKIKNRFIQVGNSKLYTGTIIKRPLDKINTGLHFAIIYGTTAEGKKLIIEHTRPFVQCIEWSNENRWTYHHFEFDDLNFDTIMARVQQVKDDVYKVGLNNCEHFVTYVVKGRAESVQGDLLVRLVDVAMMYFEIRFLNSPEGTRTLGLRTMQDLRRTLGIPSDPELSKLIRKYSSVKDPM